MKAPLLSILVLLLLFIGCEKEYPGNPTEEINDSKVVFGIDIANADYLVLKSAGDKKSGYTGHELYKINLDGDNISEEKVRLLDAFGNEIDSIFSEFTVFKMLELKEELLCLKGNFKLYLDSSNSEPQTLYSLLIRSSDGALFNFNGHYPTDKSYYLNQNEIQTDKYGNVYYDAANINSQSGNVFKLAETENGYSQEGYLPSGEEYYSYFIDLDGNCYYYKYPYTKVKKFGGGLAVSDIHTQFYCMWNTYDDKVMASVYDSIGYLTIEEEKLKFSPFASVNCPEAWLYIYRNPDEKTTQIFSPGIHESWKLAGSMIFEETQEVYDLFIDDELFTTNELYVKTISGHFLYLTSQASISFDLYKVDLNNFEKIDGDSYLLNSYTHIDFPGDLEVKDYEFNENGDIIFSALRLSDEMYVTGIVDAEDNIQILTQSSDREYNNLIRIN
ncbi:MAG: hypothetical protein WD577_09740 [Bacteroidales bacterium]